MFELLQSLVNKLQEGTSAKLVRENRRILQAVKVEAQKCRIKLVSDLKNKKQTVKKEVKEIESISEDDDDFFEKQ